jgi:hypothetical protein
MMFPDGLGYFRDLSSAVPVRRRWRHGSFDFTVNGFSDVMEQARFLGQGYIAPSSPAIIPDMKAVSIL